MFEYFLYFLFGYLIYFLWKRYQTMQLRDKLGIKGPKANFFFGNVLDLMKAMKEHDEVNQIYEIWREQYGNVYGVYLGSTLFVVIHDLEMAREILIKQFSNFQDRPHVPFMAIKPMSDMLTNLKGEKWKKVRNTLTPMFTASKLKQMSDAVDDKLNVFMNCIEKYSKSGQTFNIYDHLQGLTLDVIGKCAFAMDVKTQTDPNDPFLKNVRIFFEQLSMKNSLAMLLCFFFPEFNKIISQYRPWSKTGVAEHWMFGNLNKVIEARKKILHDFKSVDVLQILLEQNEIAEKSSTNEVKENQISYLSDSVMEANIFLFLIAGYETTSTALAFTMWLIAKHPEVQKRMQQEIDECIRSKKPVNYDTTHKMSYMDAVFRESLRLYPPVTTFLSRHCTAHCNVNGVNFAPGVETLFMPRIIHNDPDIWNDPKKFDPDRFLNSNGIHPMAWMPFGIGNRNCIGMRFADMEAKMCLFRLLSEYNLELGPGSKDTLDVQEIDFIFRPKNGVNVKIIKRT